MNRTGPDGEPMTCHKCKSVYNFISQCDSKDETLLQVGIIHEEEKERKANEGSEWCGYLAILDSGCDTSIAGVKWIEDYTRGQKGKRKQEIEDMQESRNTFVFGDETRVKLKGESNAICYLSLAQLSNAFIWIDINVRPQDTNRSEDQCGVPVTIVFARMSSGAKVALQHL